MKTRGIALVCLLLGIVTVSGVCTQFVAVRLAYHPALGTPLFWQIYNPFAWWQWFREFYSYAPSTYGYAFLIFAIGFMLSIVTFRLYVGFKTRSSRKHEGTHGTASFATSEQVREAGLLPDNGKPGSGVYCGGFDDTETGRTLYLRNNGQEHICVIAPPGSGKGVGLVVPTLLSWLKSAFILDIKGENYAMTAGWRKKHTNNVVLRYEPASGFGSCAWNPLEEIRFRTSYEISDTQNIALMLIDTDGKGLEKDHFRSAAKDLLIGLIVHSLYKSSTVGRMPCVPDIAQMLSDEGSFSALTDRADNKEQKPLTALFLEMANATLDDSVAGRQAQSIIRGSGKRFGDTTERELSGILNTANNALSLYLDPVVALNTSHSDFKVADLMDHSEPVSLFFITNPGDLVRLRPLARLLLTRIVVGLAGKMSFDEGRSKTEHRHRLLLMLDEFPTLGRMEVFESALAFIRGYDIKAYIIIQDVQQLYKAYTNYESIISNCHIRIAYAPNNMQTAKWLSEMTGQTTIIKEQISTSGKRFGGPLGNVSRSYQEVQRPLMTSDEVMRLPGATKDKDGNILSPGEMLIFVAGQPVIRGRQTPYFLDPTFDARSKIPPPDKSDSIRQDNSAQSRMTIQ